MQFTPDKPQQIFIEHMRQHPNVLGFIGMGIGKTAAVLQRLTELFLAGEAVAALVIAPLRVAALTWPAECQDWEQFRWLRLANLRTEAGQRAFLNGKAHLYLINWDAINLLVNLVERRKGKLPYDVVIYDELTKARAPGGKRVRALRTKVPRVERSIGLTGTPAPNSDRDLFGQVRLVDGGERLGKVYETFLKENFYSESYSGYPKWEPKAGASARIHARIADITCTLKTSDWLSLPDTIIEDIEVNFTPELQKRYRTLEKELVIELRKDKVMNITSSAALITKLLQFTSGHMYDDERDVHPIHNLKFDALKKLVDASEQPVLCACIFRHEQDRIRRQFPQARFFADAKNETQQRQLLADWNAKRVPLLVAHPASCGHGLNMQHGSSVMVWLSLTYSRELYEQMIARLARRGQENIIRVYRIVVPGTVDDAVSSALETKAENEGRLIAALQMLESYRTGGRK